MGSFNFNSKRSLFTKVLENIRILSRELGELNERTLFEKSLDDAGKAADVDQVRLILMDFHKKFPQSAIAEELLNDINDATRKALASDKSLDFSRTEEIARKVYYNFENSPETNKKVIPIDDILPFEVCKQISKTAIDDYYNTHQTFIYPFVVSRNKIIKGKIIEETSGKKTQILMSNNSRQNKAKDTNYTIKYIGESHALTSETFELAMYVYTFVTTATLGQNLFIEYTLLSMDPLPHDEIQITGMEIPIRDKLKIGASASIDISSPTIFVLDYTKILDHIDHAQFMKIKEDYNTHDKLYGLYYSILRQPDNFEKLLLALLFCSKGGQGYPLHFGMFGPASCGKSKILEAICGRFGERRALESGTLKSLVPNFGGNKPDPGHFVKSRRFCCVDEFLDMISKANMQQSVDVEGFNSLLMHAGGTSGSGKHADSLAVTPTAAMIFASNYKPGKANNFAEVCDKINIPFLSRFLLYNYTEAHIDYIREKTLGIDELIYDETIKTKKDISISDYIKEYSPEAIKISDYLKSAITIHKKSEIKKIFDEVQEIVPDNYKIRELYNSRTLKQITAILDGVIKYHYIIENRTGDFIAQPNDYQVTKDIWYMIVSSWTDDLSRLPYKYRIDMLPLKEKQVYYYIQDNQGQGIAMIERALGYYPNNKIGRLLQLGLIHESVVGSVKSYTTYDYLEIDTTI